MSQRNKSQLESFGYHEVIIETDLHNQDLVNGAGGTILFCSFLFSAYYLVDYLEAMFMCFLGRGKLIANDDRVHQILMFKNNGKNVLYFSI